MYKNRVDFNSKMVGGKQWVNYRKKLVVAYE